MERDDAPPASVLPWVAQMQAEATAGHMTLEEMRVERLLRDLDRAEVIVDFAAPLPGYVPLATIEGDIADGHVFEVLWHNGHAWEPGQCRGRGVLDRTAVVLNQDLQKRLFRKELLFVNPEHLDGHITPLPLRKYGRGQQKRRVHLT